MITISSACFIFNDIDELITNYNLTVYCKKCNPIATTYKKKMPLIYTFDNKDLNKANNANELIKTKFVYNNAQCSKCGYSRDGIFLNESNLICIVSNILLPTVLFICIEDIMHWKKLKTK